MSLVVNTDKGPWSSPAAGHAGVVNVVEYAPTCRPSRRMPSSEAFTSSRRRTRLAWTAARLRASGLAARSRRIAPGSRRFSVSPAAGLSWRTAVVAAVGSSFDLARESIDLAQ
jgi:hypothetical protein